MNSILREDFNDSFVQTSSILAELRNSKILVTGANGMIGSYLVKFFDFLNVEKQFNIEVTALVRTPPKVKLNGIAYIEKDVCNFEFTNDFNYVVHAASLASPLHYKENPIGTLLPNVLGTITLLNSSIRQSLKSFIFISSSEVYGVLSTDIESITEQDFGIIDPMDIRSCYAESKRMGENICKSWLQQKNVPVRIVRPFHTYGPGVKRGDGRIFADLIYSVVDQSDIILLSDGSAKRAFCYLKDALIGLLYVMLKGKNGEAYNLGNPSEEWSIYEASMKAASLLPQNNLKVVRNTPIDNGYIRSKVSRNCPSVQKLKNLGWAPSVSLEEGLMRTVEYILEEGDSGIRA